MLKFCANSASASKGISPRLSFYPLHRLLRRIAKSSPNSGVLLVF